jgi:glycosyltransferase involved in cell wall biosynthesis
MEMTDLRSTDGKTNLAPRREKVTLILHEFDRGGSGRVAAHLARGFADRGLDVELVVFRQGGDVEALLVDLMGADIPILYLGKKWAPRAIDLLRGLPRLVRHLRQRRPDVIIATANNTAWVSAAARTLSGQIFARLYLKTTNPIATSRHKGLVKSLRRWGYRRVFAVTEGVWTLSADESLEMQKIFPDTPCLFRDVINPYVTPAMLAVPAAQIDPVAHRTILGVGRLTGQKRFERLIEAFALLTEPDLHLTILGEGEERAKLTALVNRLGLSSRVSLPGFVTNVAEAFHNASVFVLPSDYEGLPAVVLEAMAANCPILCTDCFPAARSMLGATDGCAIIEQSDPQSLAAMIRAQLALPRPTNLRSIAERYSIANGIASHAAAMMHP